MLFGSVGLLIAAAGGFLTEIPPALQARLAPTNETAGSFVQVKRLASGETFVTKGDYLVRPGKDFTWRTVEPFGTLFRTTRTEYVYSNEDEVVTRPLKGLPGFSRFAAATTGDFSAFLDAFDAVYSERDGRFSLMGTPKDPRLKGLLVRLDAEGDATNLTFKAELSDRTTFTLNLADRP